MPARSEKHRHHAQAAHALVMQRRRAGRQRRLHELQEGELDTLARQQDGKRLAQPSKGIRPFGIARAVGEEDDGHSAIIAESP